MDKLLESLHPLERKVLPVLAKTTNFEEIKKETGMQDVEVVRALQWLQNKEILELKTDAKEYVLLDENGVKYSEDGLPERRFLQAIKKKSLKIGEIGDRAGLEKEEVQISLGTLKGKAAITLDKGEVKITEQGLKSLDKKSLEEKFLQKTFPIPEDELLDEERFAFDSLKKRKKIIRVDLIETKEITLTKKGEKIANTKISDKYEEKVTTQMLKSGTWEGKKFRRYDVSVKVPKIQGARPHPLNLVIEKMRQIWIEMGFEEIKGPWVESAFWCMDSMWIPQDHPAREMQDTFYLPYKGTLPAVSKKVAAVHENGGDTGSKGYGYKWNPEVAKQLLLRTHTTATTYRWFGEGKVKIPGKYFAVGRIFRNETLDATHLPEFHQIEGFVIDDGLTLRDLMGYIKEFYNKMGIYKIKFKPVYNPYTEPSMEAMGWNEELGRWVELINSGIFRPESLAPYGIDKPVIAWGLGVERLAMMLHKQDNIRNILGPNCDIDWLKSYKVPKKW